jgi:hypothetical protein
MSLLQILLAAEAASIQKAVRRTAYRHRAVRDEPLVVAVYNLAGEAAAPLAFYYGTDSTSGKLVVAPEPRNREVRFAGINEFCADLVEYINPFLETREQLVGRAGRQFPLEVALDAPQIVVPNRATREYLGARLGRSLRYLGLGKTHPVPEATQWAGAHLSWLAEYVALPGQSIFLAATELLSRHFATGQSALEDENLATLIAWIENPAGSGLTEIQSLEAARVAFGPVPNPELDTRLESHVRAFGRAVREGDKRAQGKHRRAVEDLVRDPLAAAYRATHHALDVMRRIPDASAVDSRWATDVREWGAHARRCSRAIPRFARRHDALRAARMLELWSRAAQDLEIEEAFDDPLVMAEFDAGGRCISGTVSDVDDEHREIKPGNRRTSLVPLVAVSTSVAPQLLEGDKVCWTADRKVSGEIRQIRETRSGWIVVIAILSGHKQASRLPGERDAAVFVALTTFGGPSPNGPDEVPWTHRAALSEPIAGDDFSGTAEAAGVGDAEVLRADTEDEIGPDLAPDEVLPPPAATPEPGEIPGVLL